MGLKEQLAAATKPPHREVTVGGVTVVMHGLSIAEKFELADMDGSDADQTFWLLERMVRDGDGNRLFDEDDPVLRGLDSAYINELAEVVKELLNVEEHAKNSDATPSPVALQG